jgi:hypothetical protein
MKKAATDVPSDGLSDSRGDPPEGLENRERLWLTNMKGCWRNVSLTRLGAEMTEYVIRKIGRHQWLVFADRQSIALCADENERRKR